jgi:hypothetical protein
VAAIADQRLTIGNDLVATVAGRPACAAVVAGSAGRFE